MFTKPLIPKGDNGFFHMIIDFILFKNISLIWRRHHCQWRAAKFRPTCMFGAQGLWAGRDLYRATLAVTRDLGFPSFIRRTTPFSRLLRHTRGCGESILTWILTGFFLQELHLSNAQQSSLWVCDQPVNACPKTNSAAEFCMMYFHIMISF
jgi:hypothetical protein